MCIRDRDGTLLNTIDDLSDAGNWVCAQNGWPTFTVEQFKLMVGNGIPDVYKRQSSPLPWSRDRHCRGIFCARFFSPR